MLVIKIKVCMFGQVIHLIGKTDQKVLLRFFFFFLNVLITKPYRIERSGVKEIGNLIFRVFYLRSSKITVILKPKFLNLKIDMQK